MAALRHVQSADLVQKILAIAKLTEGNANISKYVRQRIAAMTSQQRTVTSQQGQMSSQPQMRMPQDPRLAALHGAPPQHPPLDPRLQSQHTPRAPSLHVPPDPRLRVDTAAQAAPRASTSTRAPTAPMVQSDEGAHDASWEIGGPPDDHDAEMASGDNHSEHSHSADHNITLRHTQQESRGSGSYDTPMVTDSTGPQDTRVGGKDVGISLFDREKRRFENATHVSVLSNTVLASHATTASKTVASASQHHTAQQRTERTTDQHTPTEGTSAAVLHLLYHALPCCWVRVILDYSAACVAT